MYLNIFSDLRKPGLVPGKSLSPSTNINSVLEKSKIYIPFFSLLCIGTLAGKDTPCCESVLFHPVLKTYPTCHSWIITAYISLGNVDQQPCMFN